MQKITGLFVLEMPIIYLGTFLAINTLVMIIILSTVTTINTKISIIVHLWCQFWTN